MRNGWKGTALALGLVGAAAMSIPNTALAAPAAGSTVKTAADGISGATDVRWRGRRGGRYVGPAIIGGLAAGIIGAAAANAYGPRYYYPEPYHYYDGPRAYYGPQDYYGRRYYRQRHYYHW